MKKEGQGYSSVLEHVFSMHRVPALITSSNYKGTQRQLEFIKIKM